MVKTAHYAKKKQFFIKINNKINKIYEKSIYFNNS